MTFDRKIAKECALLCNIIYKGYTEIKEILPQEYLLLEYFDKQNTQAMIVQNKEKKNFIVFRGTEKGVIGDLITDVKVRKEEVNIGEVHRGFLQAYNQIKNEIAKISHRLNNIYITGHSLGGALATLSAWHLTFCVGIIIDSIYTFGSPRIGNKEFVINYDLNLKSITFRVVNNCDIVTRVPTRLTGYNHVGQLIYIDREGRFHLELEGDSLTWWATFWDRVKGRLEDFAHQKLFGGISDHAIENYYNLC